MIDEQMEEMASLYVLGELKAEQAARFEAELLGSAELQELVSALQEDFATLALAAPMVRPPAGLRARLIQQFRAENQPSKVIRVSFLPWAIAAALAVASTFLFLQETKLKKQVAALQSRDLLTQTRVAVLQSQVDTYASGSAVVIWDQKNQKGFVRYDKLPAHEGQDYQLWALDPAQKEPINAGLMPVVNSGAAKVDFHPDVRVGKGTKFAVSIEPKGGSKKPVGQVIFVGE
ncbi:MAG: anti-sigma factor [Chthoniobacterales bacterium]